MSTGKESVVQTPLMKQYYAIKEKHPDAILLFRVGDFYETFSDDAVKTSEIVGITLTRRANGAASFVELAGFPHHALDTYLPKLVRAGQRVAICDQLEDPKLTKGIVKRGITELVTPGVTTNDNILNHKENNFVASVHFDKKGAGVSFLDLSTGEFLASEGSISYIDKLLSNFKPKEVLFEKSKRREFEEHFGSRYYTFGLEDWVYNFSSANDRLLKHFETVSLKGFGITNEQFAVVAAGAILYYLDLTQHQHIKHITKLSPISESSFVWLDKFTIRNLELFGSSNEGARSLSDILDWTNTAMGSRMLKRWISLPLNDVKQITDRNEVVKYLIENEATKEDIETNLKKIGDLERLVSKVATGRITPREMVQLKNSLEAMQPIKNSCATSSNPLLKAFGEQINPCTTLSERIGNEINEDTPIQLSKGGVVKSGVDKDLDELRTIAFSGKDYLQSIQERESERTGIPSLKISFNNVFGYFIEVRNTHKDKVPTDWIRKQTLVNAERYITEELKEYESKILGAEEKILAIETRIYNNLIATCGEYILAFQVNSTLLAKLDCLYSFAEVAIKNGYACPTLDDSDVLDIKGGRHPVIEKNLPIGESYVPNDIYLDGRTQQVIMITGPNMAGKSALLRQTALIALMAQIGSYVPAKSAHIGIVDKIFTRVGASDNISQGESTFMVEMNEASSILNNITDRSLVLFDELGRGTSTYDGISIAWAIVEYIHENGRSKAKTLFATHYHELNEMENSFERVKNYNVSVRELDNRVIFLRKLVRGGSEHSFGIHVAKMAGMPKSIIKRAEEILEEMEKSHRSGEPTKAVEGVATKREGYQLSIFQLEDPVLKQIRDEIASIDINNLTPMEALNKLHEIKKHAGLK